MLSTFRTCALFLALAVSITSSYSLEHTSVAPQLRPLLDPLRRAKVLDTYGKLPLRFEVNRGQADAQTTFLARGSGFRLFLRATEAVFAFSTSATPTSERASSDAESDPAMYEPAALRMHLVGADPQARTKGLATLPGTVNYLLSDDPEQWRTHIPTYAHVLFQDVYPGVDIVYYGNQRRLEYDFILAPGADPATITLDFAGADYLTLDANGDLLLKIGSGTVQLPKPRIYQAVNGVQQDVNGGFVLRQHPQNIGSDAVLPLVGFDVDTYDPALPLLIDPEVNYATYLGGSSSEAGHDIAVDAAGNAYILGTTNSLDFPTRQPVQSAFAGPAEQSPSGPPTDLFVAKLDPTGSALVYATYLGGSQTDEGGGIAVDAAGNVYITGGTSSGDFPTANPLQPASGGGSDAFVAKLDPSGARLLYATYLGGSSDDNPTSTHSDVAIDNNGAVYVTGTTQSPDFPTKHAGQPTLGSEPNGGGDAFVAKLDAAGSELVYSTYLGGSGPEGGAGIAMDATGSAYILGETCSPNFPTVNPLQGRCRGMGDVFVTKVDPTGSTLIFSTYLGGSDPDYATGGIAVDTRGNVYVAGETQSLDFPTAAAVQPNYGGGTVDVFVAKLEPAGTALIYATYLGRSGYDSGAGIAVDDNDHTYITGFTDSPDFPTANAVQATFGGGQAMGIHGPYSPPDAFVIKLNEAGQLLFSSYLGGSGSDSGAGITVDAAGNVYVTGSTNSSNFPMAQALQPARRGPARQPAIGGPPTDAFVVKMADTAEGTNVSTTIAAPLPKRIMVMLGLLLGLLAGLMSLIWIAQRRWRRR